MQGLFFCPNRKRGQKNNKNYQYNNWKNWIGAAIK